MSHGANDAPSSRCRGTADDVEVVFRGDDEAIVLKPAGLSSERAGPPGLDSLLARVRRRFLWPDARLPHRLDRPTRGLIVVSRDAQAAARHGAEIRAGLWTKWYIARIRQQVRGADGLPIDAATLLGSHRAYIRRKGDRAVIVRSGGDPSHLTVLAVAPTTDGRDHAHALIRLDTGRFHQIRVMLAHAGFPLVGDAMYGGDVGVGGAATVRGATGQSRNIPSDGTIEFDLESIALRIERSEGAMIARLPAHSARRGVSAQLERALDQAINAPPGA